MKTSHTSHLRLVAALILLITLSGCKDTTPEGPAGTGPYTLCSYVDGLEADGYASARVSYPCELINQRMPAVTLTGGYTNIKEQMYWLANHLTKHGYVVITVTPNNILGGIPCWEDAHRDAFVQLLIENENPQSPLWNSIDIDNIALAGYSNGGAGAMEIANELGNQVKAVVGMAPFFSLFGQPDYSNLSANTLLMVGTLDTTALPVAVQGVHEKLEPGPIRFYTEMNWVSHFDWIAFGRFHNKFKGIITAWLDLTLKGSNEWEDYLLGEENQQQLADGWYREYITEGI